MTWRDYRENRTRIAEWHFDEGAGETITDSSGKGNDGTLVDMDSGSCWVTGVNGRALKFDGQNDYARVLDDLSLSAISEITVEAWVYLDLFNRSRCRYDRHEICMATRWFALDWATIPHILMPWDLRS